MYVNICVRININPIIKKYIESEFSSKFINLYLESKYIVNKNKAIDKLSNWKNVYVLFFVSLE